MLPSAWRVSFNPMENAIAVGHVSLNLTELTLPNGLRVDQIEANAAGMRISTNPVSAQTPEPGQITARVKEATLSEFLSTQLPSAVRQVDVQCVGGRIQVAVIAKVVFEIKALAMCRLEIVDEQQIFVRVESIDPGGPIATLVEGQVDRVNPVFDARDLPVPTRLLRAESTEGELRVFGEFQLS